MPSKPLIRSRENPYHVTLRCNNKEAFKSSLHDVWSIFSIEINEITEKFECKIHAFVLMPNHIHLLITTSKEDLGVVMQSFLVVSTKKLNALSGRSGRVFGARYHWSLIENHQYYDCVLKYVYRNPVKAKLSKSVELYPFSTIKYVLENYFPHFPVAPPIGLEGNIPAGNAGEFLNWLNRPFKGEEEKLIKCGFKRPRFSPPKNGWKRGSTIMETFNPMNMTL